MYVGDIKASVVVRAGIQFRTLAECNNYGHPDKKCYSNRFFVNVCELLNYELYLASKYVKIGVDDLVMWLFSLTYLV